MSAGCGAGRLQSIDESVERILGELSGVLGRRRQSPNSLRDLLSRDLLNLSQSFFQDHLGKHRGAGNRRRAAARAKARRHNPSILDAHGQLQSVATNRIGDFDARRGVGKLALVARILVVIAFGRTVHEESMASASAARNLRPTSRTARRAIVR